MSAIAIFAIFIFVIVALYLFIQNVQDWLLEKWLRRILTCHYVSIHEIKHQLSEIEVYYCVARIYRILDKLVDSGFAQTCTSTISYSSFTESMIRQKVPEFRLVSRTIRECGDINTVLSNGLVVKDVRVITLQLWKRRDIRGGEMDISPVQPLPAYQE